MKKTYKYVKIAITMGWPLLAGAATLLGSWKAFLYENINQTHLIRENTAQIEKLKKNDDMFKIYHQKIKDELSHYNLILSQQTDKVNDLLQKNKKIADYQQVLRVEVKEIAEGKLNISEFWHYVQLQEHYYDIRHPNSN